MDIGHAITAELRPKRRDRKMIGEGADKHLPDWARAHIRIRGLRKWLKKLKAKGEKLFLQGSESHPNAVFDSIPEELWDLWHETSALEGLQKDTDAENCSAESQLAWQQAISAAQGLPRGTPAEERGTPLRLPRSEWLERLLRIRISIATQAVRQAHVREKAATGWRKRLLDAHAAAEGRTGAIFEVVNPRSRAIKVTGALLPRAGSSDQWFTDSNSIRQNAADVCAKTVELNELNDRRGTRLSPEARALGELDHQFAAPNLGSLREIMAEEKPEVQAELLLKFWTAENLLAAVKGCADKAPGPSGLCYWMVEEGTPEFRGLLATLMNVFQDQRHLPDEARHSFVHPIPKSGEGGSTFEGARQICLLEILTKFIEGGITTAAMATWEERGYLHPAAHGFRKGMSAGDLAAFVAAVGERYRRSGRPLYTLSADITKAFQSVGLPAIEKALKRMGIPDDIIELWMQVDRGEWIPPTATDGLWNASYGTCQVITGFGLSPAFAAKTGCRQGARGSPFKFLVWIDMLWCWLDKEEVKGLAIDPDDPESLCIPALAFCDDIWAGCESFAELQRLTHLLDIFLQCFDVELNPTKSMFIQIGQRTGHQLGLYRWLDGARIWVPLPEVQGSASYRYLGILFQPDGGWQAMKAAVMGKVRNWCSQVSKARLPVDQAAMVLRSVVHGLLQYVLLAAPLPISLMEKIDKLVAAALFRCAGLAKGRRTAWAFVDMEHGGFGMLSATTLRRMVVVEAVLARLNAAAASVDV